MNAATTPHKMSALIKLGNTETMLIFLAQAGCCLV